MLIINEAVLLHLISPDDKFVKFYDVLESKYSLSLGHSTRIDSAIYNGLGYV